LSDRYISGRFLPDKAIDVIDEGGSRVRLSNLTRPPDLRELQQKLENHEREKNEAVASQDFEKAAKYRDEADQIKAEMERLQNEWRNSAKEVDGVVDEEIVAEVVALMTGIPLSRLESQETERLLQMEDELHKRVINQQEAIEAIARSVRRSRAGLKNPRRPMGSFIFLGPSGVGKTLLAKALAEFMFGEEEALIQIDMSEYMEKHAVSRLVGAPPGYVGFEEGGQLTEKVRRRPYAVVLLDEIEKAHSDIFNILLQVLEEGKLTDSYGRTVDMRNIILIMTSNVGAGLIKRQGSLGFGKADIDSSYERMKETIIEALESEFRPEFINRLDEVIIFRHLTKEDLRKIVELEIASVCKRLDEQNIKLEFTPEAYEFLIERGYNIDFGARPLRRTIEKFVEDPISEEILSGHIEKNTSLSVEVEEKHLVFKSTALPPEKKPKEVAAKTAANKEDQDD
ncbi:MAG: ATP-dependent Clp protease ATP-binding subunit, partial [Planctomycetes bacterium]|nr:ATP-dependent Clp protease ATP-binding subunit [Planctomycetota bacterium]